MTRCDAAHDLGTQTVRCLKTSPHAGRHGYRETLPGGVLTFTWLQNPRRVYACGNCGAATHYKRSCPKAREVATTIANEILERAGLPEVGA